MRETLSLLRPALVAFVVLMAITGLLYPYVVTGVAQITQPAAANGSLIERDGIVVGSRLIGQQFTSPAYFWGRPSATAPMPYNPLASGGSNLGPSNPALVDAVKARIEALKQANPEATGPVPMELVTASASGLDPEISLDAARWQAARVAKARGVSVDAIEGLIARHTVPATWSVLGTPRVNVLELNLALDRTFPISPIVAKGIS